MATRVGRIFLSLALLAGALLTESYGQIFLESGAIGVRVSNAGSIRFMSPSTDGTRQIERVNIIAALSKKAVCDYNEDQDVLVEAYQVNSPVVADVEGMAYYANVSTGLPPQVSFRLHTYMWTNKPFVITRFTVINDFTEQMQLYLGVVAVPRVSGNYGGETNCWDSATQTAYCYRQGENAYAGMHLLSAPAYSFKAYDWSIYSPDDPNADAATDSTRYRMTSDAGFDSIMTAGGDGSIISLNAGKYTLAAGDSVVLFYGIVYGDSFQAMRDASVAAQAKYNGMIAAVERKPQSELPDKFNLGQNYPNPFNPSTKLDFSLSEKSDVHLAVYNLQGQLVNTLAQGTYQAGSYSVQWNGRDANGREAAAGVYIYRISSQNQNSCKKMILVR